MSKFLKKILSIALALVCVLSLVACADSDDEVGATGLFCKKIGDVYTVYKYVDEYGEDGNKVTVLDIGAKLTALGLANENVRIKTQAFEGNSSLTDVIVPASVTEIEKGAFSGMKALVNLTVPFIGLNNTGDASIGDTSASEDKAVDSERTVAHFFGDTSYTEGVSQTIKYGTEDTASSTCYMPLTLKKITVKGDNNVPAGAFNGMSKSVEIVLDGAVKVIGDYAFASTSSLTKLVIPATVEKIGECAFKASAIEEFVAPSALKTIGVDAFRDCASLKVITLNQGLEISRYAFMDCANLAQIKFATDVVANGIKVGNYAFDGCDKLSKTVPAEFNIDGSVNAYPTV